MLEGTDRLILASVHLAVLGLVLLLLGRLPGKWRAWGWRLVALKTAVLLVGAIGLPLLAGEPAHQADLALLPLSPMSAGVEPVTPPGTGPMEGGPMVGSIATGWVALWLGIAGLLAARLIVLAAKPLRDLQPLPAHWPPVASTGRVRVSPHVTAPMIVGVWRPCVVLPAWTTPPPGWEAALAHELAHARRRDVLWDGVVQLFACLFWFHPMAWIAIREHRVACEEACDAEAIRQTGGSPRSYALTLVTLGRPTTGGLALGSPARTLRRRIHAMHRRPLSLRWSVPVLALGLVLCLPLELTAAPAEAEIRVSNFDHIAAAMIGRPSVRKELGVPQRLMDEIHADRLAAYPRLREIGQKTADMKTRGVPVNERVAFEVREKDLYYKEITRMALRRLSPSQRSRLRELALQRLGPLALEYPEFARAIRLSPASRKALAKIGKDAQRALSAHDSTRFQDFRRKMDEGFGLPASEKARYRKLDKEVHVKGISNAEYAEYRKLQLKINEAIVPPSGVFDPSPQRAIWARYSQQALSALTASERMGWARLQGKLVPSLPGETQMY